MSEVRKLQYISKQYCLNIPKNFVRVSGWQRGDYFTIECTEHDTLKVKRVVEQPIGADPKQRANLLSKFFSKFGRHAI